HRTPWYRPKPVRILRPSSLDVYGREPVKTPSIPLDKGMARKLSAGLGWFSLGLGAAQLAVPGRVNSLIGVQDTARARLLQRLFGAQEVGMGMGIFAVPRRDMIVWNRVAGDAIHISLMA